MIQPLKVARRRIALLDFIVEPPGNGFVPMLATQRRLRSTSLLFPLPEICSPTRNGCIGWNKRRGIEVWECEEQLKLTYSRRNLCRNGSFTTTIRMALTVAGYCNAWHGQELELSGLLAVVS